MTRYISDIRQSVRQILRDEFVEGTTQDWQDDEIDVHIEHTREEISQESPNVVVEVKSTIGNSRVLDISAIEDIISIDRLEYPTGENYRAYRNFNRIDNGTIEIDTTLTPDAGTTSTLTGTVTFTSGSAAITGSGTTFKTTLSADDHIRKSTGTRWYRIYSIESETAMTLAESCRSGDTGADTIDVTAYLTEAVYLYCNKLHTLTDDDSSLRADEEKVLIDGTVAYAALSWVNENRTNINEAVTLMTTTNTAISSMTARVTQAIADLVSGRVKIGAGVTQAMSLVDSMSARITQAVTDISTGRALIGDERATAKTELDKISAEITLAIADLANGRADIDDNKDTADTAIDNMTNRINQSIDNLQLGQTFINKVNYGGNPQSDFANYAGSELSNANTFLGQARGYLGEITTADRFGANAAREMQAANTLISEAQAYLSLDSETAEHANYAARELANANASLSQARGYLALDVESTPYANYAAREVQNANLILAQATGYIREASSRLSIASAVNAYQTWANNRIALYRKALLKITKPRNWKQYPKD